MQKPDPDLLRRIALLTSIVEYGALLVLGMFIGAILIGIWFLFQ